MYIILCKMRNDAAHAHQKGRKCVVRKNSNILTEWHFKHVHLLWVLLCQLWDTKRILPEGVCVLVDIKWKELGISQQENEPASHLGYCVEPLEVRIIKLLYYLKGFIHTVVDWVTAVTLCLLKTHIELHAYFRNCKWKLQWNFDLKMRLGVKCALSSK